MKKIFLIFFITYLVTILCCSKYPKSIEGTWKGSHGIANKKGMIKSGDKYYSVMDLPNGCLQSVKKDVKDNKSQDTIFFYSSKMCKYEIAGNKILEDYYDYENGELSISASVGEGEERQMIHIKGHISRIGFDYYLRGYVDVSYPGSKGLLLTYLGESCDKYAIILIKCKD